MNNMLNLSPDGKRVTLCARKTCCPTMELEEDGTVIITDDDGNTVRMSVEQARLLGYGANSLTEKRQLLHD